VVLSRVTACCALSLTFPFDHFFFFAAFPPPDDVGAAFGMGCIGGLGFNFIKTARNTPSNMGRWSTAWRTALVKGPQVGTGFAAWGGLFSAYDCTLVAIRGKEGPSNAIIAGALTGATLTFRSGRGAMVRSAAVGALILALIEGVSYGLTKMLMPPANNNVSKPPDIPKQAEKKYPFYQRAIRIGEQDTQKL